MDKKISNALLATAGLLSFCGANSHAYEAGDMIVRAGFSIVAPEDMSAVSAAPDASLYGADVIDVEEGYSLGFSGTYMVNSRFGLELLLALPFIHDIEGLGPLEGVYVGETQHLPPTLSAQVYPDIGIDKVQPYFGVGLNYTTFFSEELSSAAKSALNASGMSIDDSLSYAFQAGIDIEVSESWYVNLAYWRINIDSVATVKTAAGDIDIDMRVDPHVVMLGGAYRF